jgi:hypothetical protein
MSIFGNLFRGLIDSILGKAEPESIFPGVMGKILAHEGIYAIGPHNRTGTPMSVLNGCKEELVLIPGASALAFTKEGKPIMAKAKTGRAYQVTENYAVTRKQWKAMQNDQKRKAAGKAVVFGFPESA